MGDCEGRADEGVYFLAYLPESATSFDESHPFFLAYRVPVRPRCPFFVPSPELSGTIGFLACE